MPSIRDRLDAIKAGCEPLFFNGLPVIVLREPAITTLCESLAALDTRITDLQSHIDAIWNRLETPVREPTDS